MCFTCTANSFFFFFFFQLKLNFPSCDVIDAVPVVSDPVYKPLVNHVRALSLMHDEVTVGPLSALQLSFLVKSVHLTTDSPSVWQLSASCGSAPAVLVNSGEFRSHNAELKLALVMGDVINILGQNQDKQLLNNDVTINFVWEAMLYYCLRDSQLCLMKQLLATVPVRLDSNIQSSKDVAAIVSISSLG